MLKRLMALFIKEFKQLTRDKTSLSIGIVMPIVLLLLFGYALSMDLKNVRLALVCPDASPATMALRTALRESPYFELYVVRNADEARRALVQHAIDAALYMPEQACLNCVGHQQELLLTVNAVNANQARLIESYVQGTLMTYFQTQQLSPVTLQSRIWFNECNDSRWYLVPGVLVIVITIIGSLLTALVMAREYEHGNVESLFVTPVRPGEILLAKAAVNFLLGALGFLLCIAAAYFLFSVPFRGSIILLLGGSAAYLGVCLCLGLVISTVTKNQFLASQYAVLLSFVPAFMLSGLLYQIENMPRPIQIIASCFPARYYFKFLQTSLLSGDVMPVLRFNGAVLIVFMFIFMLIAKLKTRKRL